MIILTIPKHIAIIMDGNGRWAKKKSLPRHLGHVAGAKAIKDIAVYCNSLGVELLTLYAFSTENWNRPKFEVKSLLILIKNYLKNMDFYLKYGIKIKFFGNLSVFSEELQTEMEKVEQKFQKNSGMTLGIALNYGGRNEIAFATRQIALKFLNKEIKLNEINENLFKKYLYTGNYPDVDLLIRTGSEFRLSNFLLWQIAYAELIFMDKVLWPDFKPEHIDLALEQFNKRNRTYGKVK